MNKRQLERLKKRHQRIWDRLEKAKEKSLENGRRKRERLLKRVDSRKVKREKEEKKTTEIRKEALTHAQKIEKNRASKALARLFGEIPPLKRKPKKHYSEFKGYYYIPERNKFRVRFSYKGKRYALGEYDTPEIAHNVYLVERARVVKETLESVPSLSQS